MDVELEKLATAVIGCGIKVHRQFGPGLLESVYETALHDILGKNGLGVERQRPVDIIYNGQILSKAFRIDLLVEEKLVIEIKSLEHMAPVHAKQLLTYLRLSDLKLGLLMNFGANMFREGIRRVSNNYFGDWRNSE